MSKTYGIFELKDGKNMKKKVYLYIIYTIYSMGLPGGSDGKVPACNAGDLGSIPGSERSGEGNGNPLQ